LPESHSTQQERLFARHFLKYIDKERFVNQGEIRLLREDGGLGYTPDDLRRAIAIARRLGVGLDEVAKAWQADPKFIQKFAALEAEAN